MPHPINCPPPPLRKLCRALLEDHYIDGRFGRLQKIERRLAVSTTDLIPSAQIERSLRRVRFVFDY